LYRHQPSISVGDDNASAAVTAPLAPPDDNIILSLVFNLNLLNI
jgi:hypothetical protein